MTAPTPAPSRSALPVYHLPGPPGEAGFAHGRALRDDLFAPAFIDAYLARLGAANRFTPDDLRSQAARWLLTLPEHFQEEIAGMGAGAGVGTAVAAEFLYADIARASGSEATSPDAILTPGSRSSGIAPTPAVDQQTRMIARGATEGDADNAADDDSDDVIGPQASSGGPMCSAVIVRLRDRATWIARNCDWLTPTLMRGTAAVIHEAPHRIPVMAVGIRGDIDLDTGINAERLWLHLHTLPALDTPPASRSMISWLFWAREALEQCATLDQLDAFIAATTRDRGVLAVAGDGKTNEAAIFACTRAGHTRHDFDPARPFIATNHPPDKVIDADRIGKARPGGTIGRHCAMQAHLERRRPQHGPVDLINALADPQVEMRSPTWMRTIYAAVVRPVDGRLWFASGRPDGAPAASTGKWAPVPMPW